MGEKPGKTPSLEEAFPIVAIAHCKIVATQTF
jgi:hypothetical protein